MTAHNCYKFMASSALIPCPQAPPSPRCGFTGSGSPLCHPFHLPLPLYTFASCTVPLGIWEILKKQNPQSSYNLQHFQIVKHASQFASRAPSGTIWTLQCCFRRNLGGLGHRLAWSLLAVRCTASEGRAEDKYFLEENNSKPTGKKACQSLYFMRLLGAPEKGKPKICLHIPRFRSGD